MPLLSQPLMIFVFHAATFAFRWRRVFWFAQHLGTERGRHFDGHRIPDLRHLVVFAAGETVRARVGMRSGQFVGLEHAKQNVQPKQLIALLERPGLAQAALDQAEFVMRSDRWQRFIGGVRLPVSHSNL